MNLGLVWFYGVICLCADPAFRLHGARLAVHWCGDMSYAFALHSNIIFYKEWPLEWFVSFSLSGLNLMNGSLGARLGSQSRSR